MPTLLHNAKPADTVRLLLHLILFLAGSVSAASAGASCPPVVIERGVDDAGQPTQRWIDAIRDRVDSGTLRQISETKRLLSDAEEGWTELAERESSAICARLAPINASVPTVTPPRALHILIGNQAGDDAFAAGPDTIVLDLGVFAATYGPADGQGPLLDRILLHEYTHLLLGPYLETIGWSEERTSRDPYLRALRVLYNEGIANLRSIQDPKWVAADGSLTPLAVRTIAGLEPVMLERLQKLEENPSPESAKQLLRNISQGPFAGKWGAVPIALWLQKETGGSPARLRKWVRGGPGNILRLAVRNADLKRRQSFAELLAAARAHYEHGDASGGTGEEQRRFSD